MMVSASRWTRKIQIALRPFRLVAEASQVADDLVDLLGGEQILERRHDLRKGASRATVVDDRAPLNIRLDGRCRTVREIGKRRRRLESREMLRLSGAIGSVTRHAAGLVNFLTRHESERADGRRRLRGCDTRMRDDQQKDDTSCAGESRHARKG